MKNHYRPRRSFIARLIGSRSNGSSTSTLDFSPAGVVYVALPVTSTTVLVDAGFIAGYPSNVWTIQTPQAFEATWLLEAHNKAARQAFLGTDTASVVEWAGGEVAVIEGEADNIKITTPDDLSRAERIAANRRSAG